MELIFYKASEMDLVSGLILIGAAFIILVIAKNVLKLDE